jgi:DNA (cytosine-5)-methyltransferase 1
LSQILQATVPSKYYLTKKACLGILRRATERGKPLPPQLETALKIQAGLTSAECPVTGTMAFHINQREETIDLGDTAGALMATQSMQMQTFVAAGFCAGAGASAGSVGYQDEVAPTLKASPSGNMAPSVLCLNDQGGQVMEWSENVSGTLRAQEHGHQPLVFENHGIDGRYTGPHSVAPTMSAAYGTGGNNVPLVASQNGQSKLSAAGNSSVLCISGNAIDRQPKNGGNGIGFQQDMSYTLTTVDRHAVCDASLIRRLTPTECERLQGYPDGWTDLPGASDSARYKALGNSVAIPCVDQLLHGIALVLQAE